MQNTNSSFLLHIFCNYLQMKIAFVVPHPGIKPNCISSISTCYFINFSVTLSSFFRIWSVNFSPLQFPFFKASLFPFYQFTIVLCSHSARITPSPIIWFTGSVIMSTLAFHAALTISANKPDSTLTLWPCPCLLSQGHR